MNNLPDYSQLLQSDKKSIPVQTTKAWLVIILFGVITLFLLAIGGVGAKALNFIFPLGSLIVAWFLYFRYPTFYIGFVWWNIFLVCFVRRLADFRIGSFTDSSPILLAPYLSILVCGHTLYFNLPKVRERGTIPFVLALASVMYGYCVGLLYPNASPVKVTVALLGWIAPLFFGHHLYINWRRYPEYSRLTRNVFLWGALIMGLYGIYQYVVAPEWERLWLVGSGMDSSSGTPEPYGMRVWSTLNSTGVFADVIATALLVLCSCNSPILLPAAISGGFALLLTSVRTGWLGWLAGMLFMSVSLKPKQQMRLVLGILILALCIVPIVSIEPFATNIAKRFSTFSDLENDNSAQGRKLIYQGFFEHGIYNFIGDGIGINEIVDSGPLSLVLDLGWIGSIPYVGSLILIVTTLFRNQKNQADLFVKAACGILVKSVCFFLAARITVGITGIIIWGFLGIGLAGQHYLQQQKQLALNFNNIEAKK